MSKSVPRGPFPSKPCSSCTPFDLLEVHDDNSATDVVARCAGVSHGPEFLSLRRHIHVPGARHLDEGTYTLQRGGGTDVLLWRPRGALLATGRNARRSSEATPRAPHGQFSERPRCTTSSLG